MKILIMHSEVPPDAPPDEQDTLAQAEAVRAALTHAGHDGVVTMAFEPNVDRLMESAARSRAELIFNLVESVGGRSTLAPAALKLMELLGLPITGSDSRAMNATSDKLHAKRRMARAAIPTPAWSEGPDWKDVRGNKQWIVKSADEDASLGLDDGSVAEGRAHVIARAEQCVQKYGGRWFAEEFVEGREFNVAIWERGACPEILPIAEMRFENWDAERPQIVGYAAKWNPDRAEFHNTVRDFRWAAREPELLASLQAIGEQCWSLFGCTGYARVDFRVDNAGRPFVLEVNVNPCLEPGAGFAAAAAERGIAYEQLIERICASAIEATERHVSRYRSAS